MATRITSRKVARFGAPLLFIAAAAYEIVALVAGLDWPRFDHGVRLTFALFNIPLWLASAVILAMQTRKALYVPVWGAFMLFCEAVVARAGGSMVELVYLAILPFILAFEGIDINVALGRDRHDRAEDAAAARALPSPTSVPAPAGTGRV